MNRRMGEILFYERNLTHMVLGSPTAHSTFLGYDTFVVTRITAYYFLLDTNTNPSHFIFVE